METTFVIKTSWDYSPKKFEYREQLEEEAKRRAFEMIQDGYTSGELHCYVNNRDCRGWWELNTQNN